VVNSKLRISNHSDIGELVYENDVLIKAGRDSIIYNGSGQIEKIVSNSLGPLIPERCFVIEISPGQSTERCDESRQLFSNYMLSIEVHADFTDLYLDSLCFANSIGIGKAYNALLERYYFNKDDRLDSVVQFNFFEQIQDVRFGTFHYIYGSDDNLEIVRHFGGTTNGVFGRDLNGILLDELIYSKYDFGNNPNNLLDRKVAAIVPSIDFRDFSKNNVGAVEGYSPLQVRDVSLDQSTVNEFLYSYIECEYPTFRQNLSNNQFLEYSIDYDF
jgi:hypothetical protein